MKRKAFFLMFLSVSVLAAGCGNGVIRELPAMELPARELPAEETKFSLMTCRAWSLYFPAGQGPGDDSAGPLGRKFCRDLQRQQYG